MPTAWRSPGDGEYEAFKLARFDILELAVYDDKAKAQGTALVGVLKKGEPARAGMALYGVYLGASDEYYRYWATEGEGAGHREKGIYHLCGETVAKCIELEKLPGIVHSDGSEWWGHLRLEKAESLG